MKQKSGARSRAAAIFLIAFAFGLNITGVTPVLGILNVMYKEHGTGMIQLLQTLPYALLMAGSLLVGRLAAKWSKKMIASIGLLIIGICGILPFFYEGFYLLFVSRLLIGFGFGITSPMNIALIAEFFPPEKRPGYMGIHVVGMGAGTIMGNFAGGLLARLGFQYFFLVYLDAVIVMLAIQVLLPAMAKTAAAKNADMRLNKTVYLISAASFAHTLFITAYSTNIAIYLMEKITNDTAMAGMVTAVNAAFALLVGAAFAKISGALKRRTLPASIFAAALGYAAILALPGAAGVFIGSACCGASLSCFMAQCSFMISVSVKSDAVAKASGMFSVIGGIGGLVSPVLLGTVSARIFGSGAAGNQFLLSGIGMAALALAALFLPARYRVIPEK